MNISELHTIYSNECGYVVDTDTRKLRKGSLFFAWKGEKDDGNRFAQQALDNGAQYVVIDNPEFALDDRCILVEDSIKTLQDLAKFHREQFTIPVLAIGGSNGKTTTKELVASVLKEKYKIHVTEKNFNNHTGVPLTLLAMHPDTECAVVEIGANHAGEHSALLDVLQPTHVLVTNNGKDHLEGFGSTQGVRKANAEIFVWAEKHNAQIFVNKFLLDLVEDSSGSNQILYPEFDFQGTSDIFASINYDDLEIKSRLFGSFNEVNILAAVVIGIYFDVEKKKIKESIEGYTPELNRSQIVNKENYTVIMDCYNANPSSMELALLDVFTVSQEKKKIIIIGDMAELGSESSFYHKEILELVNNNISTKDIVICVGSIFSSFQEKYPFHFFENINDAKIFFTSLEKKDALVFLKASRSLGLENIL